MLSRGHDYYRTDGVRIQHDPFAHGMAEKYGTPGKTDKDGFDPYADSVGAGIYGGIVERNEKGEIVVGAQYQNHNPKPGPVYAGGGYTPVTKALGDRKSLIELLKRFPDLVNDVSTGGAQPLHNCGMSRSNQAQVDVLISHGADIEAVDTYGMTPLMRMASNNLDVGAKLLLESGADPMRTTSSGETAMDIALASRAMDVVEVLRTHGEIRTRVDVTRIVIMNAGKAEVNGDYYEAPASKVPQGFQLVCEENQWDTQATWSQLNGSEPWFSAANGAYIYFNKCDGHFWIDGPQGNGVYKARSVSHAPPSSGWKVLGSDEARPAPVVASFRSSLA